MSTSSKRFLFIYLNLSSSRWSDVNKFIMILDSTSISKYLSIQYRVVIVILLRVISKYIKKNIIFFLFFLSSRCISIFLPRLGSRPIGHGCPEQNEHKVFNERKHSPREECGRLSTTSRYRGMKLCLLRNFSPCYRTLYRRSRLLSSSRRPGPLIHSH